MKKHAQYTRLLCAVCLVAAMVVLAACSNMSPGEQRVLSGAGIGAAAGAGVTAVTGGCITCGTAIGAGVGAAGGYIVDQSKKNK